METRTRRRLLSSEGVASSQKKAKTTTVTALKERASCSDAVSIDKGRLLFDLAANDPLVEATLLRRPSKRNRSPYVADVRLRDDDREAIAHVPNLDMGGKCIPGTTLLLKPARTPKGDLVGAHAVSPKYGTPKCEFHTQLVYVDETSWSSTLYTPTWVGAHPSLGEKVAKTWLEEMPLEVFGWSSPIVRLQAQVRNPGGADMRSDFLVVHEDGTERIVEVKTVVDTDYAVEAAPPAGTKCVFTNDVVPYRRTALFPWGAGKQKGPEGEAVVSARAIHHVRELTRLQQRDDIQATILFVVIRGDAVAFRANHEACPSFAKYLKLAQEAGVQVVARSVTWGTDKDRGKCYDGVNLAIEQP